MIPRRDTILWMATLTLLIGAGSVPLCAQTARFESYGIQRVPENANVNLFPYYGDFAFFQSVGVRYMVSSGEGMAYLYGEGGSGTAAASGLPSTQYGQIKKDGIDFPLVSQLTLRNYLLISKYASIDLSVSLTYRAFPNGTEEDTFDVEIIDPGFYAQMGDFSFGVTKDGWLGSFSGRNVEGYSGSKGRSGFSANLSMDYELTQYLRGRVYDRPSYRVDYVDAHGYSDTVSGQRYPVFQNIVGTDLDWQMASDKSFGYSFSRTDTIPQENTYDISKSVVYHSMGDYRQQLSSLTAAGVRVDQYWRTYEETRGKQFQQDFLGYVSSDVTENSVISAGLGYSIAELTQAGSYETNGTSDAVIGNIGLQTRLNDTTSHGISYTRYQRAGFMSGFEVVDAIGYQIQWADPESWVVGFATSYETVEPRLVSEAPYSDWLNQISASRPLTHDLFLTMASAYSLRMNGQVTEGDIGSDDLFLTNDYDTWASTVGLIKTLTDRLKLYVYVEHLERLSANASLAGTRDTVGLTLGYYNDF